MTLTRMWVVPVALLVMWHLPLRAQVTSRLIAKTISTVRADLDVLPGDTIAYYYEGVRGGDLTHQMKFTNSKVWSLRAHAFTLYDGENQTFDASSNLLSTSSIPGNTYSHEIVYTYDASNNVTSVATSYQPHHVYHRTVYTYDGNNNMTSEAYQDWDNIYGFYSVRRKVYTYDGGNKLQTRRDQIPGPGGWDTGVLTTYYYNGSDQLILEKEQIWDIPTATFINSGTRIYTYDGNFNCISNVWQTTRVTGTVYGYKNTMTYDARGALFTDTNQTWVDSLGDWVYGDLYIDSNDADGNQLQSIRAVWQPAADSFLYIARTESTWNSYNQQTSFRTSKWNSAIGWLFQDANNLNRYFYEEYVSETPVVKKDKVSIKLFPNPASDVLSIQIKQDDADPLNIAVFDISGRVICSMSNSGGTTFNRTIPISSWAAGVYFLAANTTNGSSTKQFVVRH